MRQSLIVSVTGKDIDRIRALALEEALKRTRGVTDAYIDEALGRAEVEIVAGECRLREVGAVLREVLQLPSGRVARTDGSAPRRCGERLLVRFPSIGGGPCCPGFF